MLLKISQHSEWDRAYREKILLKMSFKQVGCQILASFNIILDLKDEFYN